MVTTEQIKEWINKGEVWRFYKTPEWQSVKAEVIEENHGECYICKREGRLTRYDEDKDGNRVPISTVHHIQWLKKYPELALSKTYEWNGKTYPNLIPVCKKCHNKLHPEKYYKHHQKRFWTEEKW